MSLSLLSSQLDRTLPAWSFLREASLLEHAWKEVGGALSDYTQIVGLEHQRLVLETSYAPVIQEIKFRRQELVRRLNTYFSKPWLQDLTIRPQRS